MSWQIIHGDCMDEMSRFSDKHFAHVITDPPYEKEAHTKGRRLKVRREVIEAPLSFGAISETERDASASEFARLSSRWVIIFAQVEATMKWQAAVTANKIHSPRRIGVWVKPDGMPQLTGDRPAMGYESIVFTHRKGRSKWNGGGRSSVFIHNKTTPGGKHFHETQKPISLMMELVELFTNPGETILDPFCGSGSTGVACIRLGRKFIGIEKDGKYAALARERLAAESRGLDLRSARSGQTSIFDLGVK